MLTRRVANIHRRRLAASVDDVAAVLATLGTDEDRLWPVDEWPRMRFDGGVLAVGVEGGHGPISYTVAERTRTRVWFAFTAPAGFGGGHGFAIEPEGDRTVLRHDLRMLASASALITWPLVWRPLHNALIEDSLDRATRELGLPVPPRLPRAAVSHRAKALVASIREYDPTLL